MTGAVHVNDYVNVHVVVDVDVNGFACGQAAPQTSVYSVVKLSAPRN